MKGYTSSIVEAKNLESDDWFKMAGQLVRIASISRNADRTYMRIVAAPFPFKTKNVFRIAVPIETKFKIYNQK